MPHILRTVCWCVFASTAILVSAQTLPDSLAGVVTNQQGAAVGNAPIQIKQTQTGAIARTRSAADGRFTFANLPDGPYELSINLPCCLYRAFRRTDISIVAGATSRIDVRLEEGS